MDPDGLALFETSTLRKSASNESSNITHTTSISRINQNPATRFPLSILDPLFKEVPTYKLITPSVLVDRLRINGSLARVAVRDLAAKGLIKPIVISKKQMIYTRATKDEDVPAATEKVEKKKVQKKKAADEEEEDDE
ncbi:hypothetical protein CcCBS67573_g05368 [Chytriomyces confervae]|uniref:40S ribosomal protein S25 n=1 Tax=Chytriomyces confervae TaxID=246404 RepID=A0A507FB61_9FUNG|nr:hypothetical protein CcCBS67573_g05368 [Chytriomyces confervae]